MMRNIFLFFYLFLLACQTPAERQPATGIDWAKGAVWYQIFPERFCNGDTTNDPTAEEVPETNNPHWQTSPWTDDWYKLQPWEKETGKSFYDGSVVFARRYGGDLIGIMKKLDYLKELGIDAIYLNPIFEAPSLHKYDGATYHHIDDNFGPNPSRDKKRLARAGETDDPSTWIWTSADSAFLKLIREAHRRNIRVVIDGVFNHTGTEFFAFKDILKNGAKSRYASWYEIKSWDNPETPENEFDYKCWWGVRTLPELAEDENGIVNGPKEYIFAATRRWMDPNNDGEPSDGIDGWRLDVAQEVAPQFWREWYALVKSINPGAITVAEIWDDASAWISDSLMDDTMNYQFAYATVDFFIDQKTKISSAEMVNRLQKILSSYGKQTAPILWNLLDSHDTDRLASMIINPDRNYDRNNGLRDNPNYEVRKPNAHERQIQKQIVAFQMTFLGAPVIYYGDEAGMWGADDPDDRKPMVWPELNYEPEASHPVPGKTRPVDKVAFDRELFSFYKKLIALRKKTPAIKFGNIRFLRDPDPDLLVFARETQHQQAFLIFNRSDQPKMVRLPGKEIKFDRYRNPFNEAVLKKRSGPIELNVSARWFLLFISENSNTD